MKKVAFAAVLVLAVLVSFAAAEQQTLRLRSLLNQADASSSGGGSFSGMGPASFSASTTSSSSADEESATAEASSDLDVSDNLEDLGSSFATDAYSEVSNDDGVAIASSGAIGPSASASAVTSFMGNAFSGEADASYTGEGNAGSTVYVSNGGRESSSSRNAAASSGGGGSIDVGSFSIGATGGASRSFASLALDIAEDVADVMADYASESRGDFANADADVYIGADSYTDDQALGQESEGRVFAGFELEATSESVEGEAAVAGVATLEASTTENAEADAVFSFMGGTESNFLTEQDAGYSADANVAAKSTGFGAYTGRANYDTGLTSDAAGVGAGISATLRSDLGLAADADADATGRTFAVSGLGMIMAKSSVDTTAEDAVSVVRGVGGGVGVGIANGLFGGTVQTNKFALDSFARGSGTDSGAAIDLEASNEVAAVSALDGTVSTDKNAIKVSDVVMADGSDFSMTGSTVSGDGQSTTLSGGACGSEGCMGQIPSIARVSQRVAESKIEGEVSSEGSGEVSSFTKTGLELESTTQVDIPPGVDETGASGSGDTEGSLMAFSEADETESMGSISANSAYGDYFSGGSMLVDSDGFTIVGGSQATTRGTASQDIEAAGQGQFSSGVSITAAETMAGGLQMNLLEVSPDGLVEGDIIAESTVFVLMGDGDTSSGRAALDAMTSTSQFAGGAGASGNTGGVAVADVNDGSSATVTLAGESGQFTTPSTTWIVDGKALAGSKASIQGEPLEGEIDYLSGAEVVGDVSADLAVAGGSVSSAGELTYEIGVYDEKATAAGVYRDDTASAEAVIVGDRIGASATIGLETSVEGEGMVSPIASKNMGGNDVDADLVADLISSSSYSYDTNTRSVYFEKGDYGKYIGLTPDGGLYGSYDTALAQDYAAEISSAFGMDDARDDYAKAQAIGMGVTLSNAGAQALDFYVDDWSSYLDYAAAVARGVSFAMGDAQQEIGGADFGAADALSNSDDGAFGIAVGDAGFSAQGTASGTADGYGGVPGGNAVAGLDLYGESAANVGVYAGFRGADASADGFFRVDGEAAFGPTASSAVSDGDASGSTGAGGN
ncbi:hypothetical protein HOP50_09g54220 [Chloropicon primus]|uniref:Uncharacterized protein n=1 Tax=Chloropicon primus TaxID=1764295 RepID=A0A5B8MSS1_9CHLO|nr:hypothetical protein A3770_09p53920 [Chloropicon primus]UPR02098.1 hypothetical protein HOP50_09g54220 [Chloropicon primus]|eukprot:QDZ22874.1 hypothetical protein A3770_09p53920 [Chloropicon primus]